ncbi:hypothetical protein [Microbacterium sp. BF1]|uniref:ApeA N-terminal domain 1-containing protein n=1 Tax=Microbacterium sp. BF1 TaxID=2821146 RepID=UPI000D89D753|nr:hypothetical protein [Microbacterium sp. BF1]
MKRTLHPTGDFQCNWHIPGEDGTLRSFPGTLAVRGGERPAGDMHGVDPSEAEDQYPIRRRYPVLTATLASGGSVLLTDVEVETFMPGRAWVQAGAAVISVASFVGGVVPQANEIELQIESLDALSGIMPLKPDDSGADSWAARRNPEAILTWVDAGITMTLDYVVTSGGLDPFSLRVEASPRLTIRSESSLTLAQWIDDWVEPMQRVCSLASGRACRVTYVVLRASSGEPGQLLQLYARGITQEPYESEYREIFGRTTGVNLRGDDVSLLTLARGWQVARDEQHPIVETYGSMLLVNDHPRSRFLLLLQALEGAHGFQHRSAFEERLASHEAKVEALLVKVRACTNAKDRNKIKSAMKLVHPGLEEALTDVFDLLPIDTLPWFERTSLVKHVRARENVTVVGALRTVRNDLAHGNRGYDTDDLRRVVLLLDRVVRAQALKHLGCSEPTIERVLRSGGKR